MIKKSSCFVVLLCLIAASLSLSACSLFSPVKSENATTYVINTVPSKKSVHRRTAINLLVTPPQGSNIYNTSSMAYTIRPHEVSYFAKNRWIEPPAQMLRPLIVKTLENTRYFHYVSSNSAFGLYDFTLNTFLVKLQEDYSHAPPYTVRLILKAEIVRNSDNTVIATKEFSVSKPLQQNSPYAGVIAVNEATASLLQQLAQFCIAKIRS